MRQASQSVQPAGGTRDARAGAFASPDPKVRERARNAAREAREHRAELEELARNAMAERLSRLLDAKPLSLAQQERRYLRVIEIAATGELVIPSEVVQAAKAGLDHIRWRFEQKNGRARQAIDVTAMQAPVIVRDNVQAQLPTTTGCAFASDVIDVGEIAKQSTER